MKNVDFKDLKIIDYKEAWDKQELMFKEGLAFKSSKSNNSEETFDNTFVICEHPHVYTLGKSGEDSNLLISDDFLNKINATYYRINRGGDITYHGPAKL